MYAQTTFAVMDKFQALLPQMVFTKASVYLDSGMRVFTFPNKTCTQLARSVARVQVFACKSEHKFYTITHGVIFKEKMLWMPFGKVAYEQKQSIPGNAFVIC